MSVQISLAGLEVPEKFVAGGGGGEHESTMSNLNEVAFELP